MQKQSMQQAKGDFGDPIWAYLKAQALVDHVLFYSHIAPKSHEIDFQNVTLNANFQSLSKQSCNLRHVLGVARYNIVLQYTFK